MTQEGSPPAGSSPPQAAPPPTAPPAPPSPASRSKDERTWGMLCHLSALAGSVVPGIGCFLGPLVVWLIKKEQYPFVNEQGKESLNWQLTMLIGFAICIPLAFIVIGIPLMGALGVLDLVFVILASIKANDGVSFKYPFRIQFIK